MSLHMLAEQGFAADALQRPLRFRFQARLKLGVRLQFHKRENSTSPLHRRSRPYHTRRIKASVSITKWKVTGHHW